MSISFCLRNKDEKLKCSTDWTKLEMAVFMHFMWWQSENPAQGVRFFPYKAYEAVGRT